MSYAVGAWVQHADGEAIVVEVIPGYRKEYRIQFLSKADGPEGGAYAIDGDLTDLGTLPAKNVGDEVVVGGRVGTIDAVDGTTYTVSTTRELTANLEVPVTMKVPRWRLELG